MGRIVIPSVRAQPRRQRRGVTPRQKSGYFARGFGPKEMELIAKLTDLAVAGGGQIARAFQLDAMEEEQEQQQADYKKEVQAAAAEELRNIEVLPQVDQFFAESNLNAPAAMPGAERFERPAALPPMPLRGAEIIGTSRLAPEDMRRRVLGQADEITAMAGPLAPPAQPGLELKPSMQPGLGADLPESRVAAMLERRAQGLPPAAPQSGAFRPDPYGRPAIPGTAGPVRRSLPGPVGRSLQPHRFVGPETDPDVTARQREDIMSRARQRVGPAPERKPFRMADILAAAPAARTAEDRAMLLRAASESPDAQPGGLSDLALGAYRDRAMQAVVKLFPEELGPETELETLRKQKAREDIKSSRLRQQKLQAELDKSAKALGESVSKSRKISRTLRDTGDTDGADKQHYIGEWAHYWGGYSTKTGIFSDREIAKRIAAEKGAKDVGDEGAALRNILGNKSLINERRETLWRNFAGPMAGEDASSVLGAIYRIWPDEGSRKQRRTNKGLRKANESMVRKAVALDQKRAEAEIAIRKAQETSDITRGRQADRPMSSTDRRVTRDSIARHSAAANQADANVATLRAMLGKPDRLSEIGTTPEAVQAKILAEQRTAKAARDAIGSHQAALDADAASRREGAPAVAPAQPGAVYAAPAEGETEQEKWNRLNALLK